jgi:hypothetical protein
MMNSFQGLGVTDRAIEPMRNFKAIERWLLLQPVRAIRVKARARLLDERKAQIVTGAATGLLRYMALRRDAEDRHSSFLLVGEVLPPFQSDH